MHECKVLGALWAYVNRFCIAVDLESPSHISCICVALRRGGGEIPGKGVCVNRLCIAAFIGKSLSRLSPISSQQGRGKTRASNKR